MELPRPVDGATSLEGLFITFTRALLAQAERLVDILEYETHTKFTSFSRGNRHSVNNETVPSYGKLLYFHFYDRVLLMEEAEHCARNHWEAGILHLPMKSLLFEKAGISLAPSSSFEYHQMGLIRELLLPIIDIAKRYNTLQPTDEQIIERYTIFKERWMAPSIRRDIILPLFNFTSTLDHELQLGRYFWVAPFPPDEKSEVWNRTWEVFKRGSSKWQESSTVSSVVDPLFKLVGVCFQQKDSSFEPNNVQEVADELRNVFTALRLLKSGNVGAATQFEKEYPSSLEPLTNPFFPIQANEYQVRQKHFDLPYMFDETDLLAVRRLLSALQKLNPLQQSHGRAHAPSRPGIAQGELTVALRHFNQAYGRTLSEDRVIDLVIALESCLFASKETELKYRFSLRGTALLAAAKVKDWEPHKSQLLLSMMYDIRSAIVHNGMQLADLGKELRKLQRIGIQPDEFLQHSENIVRDILRVYVLRLSKGESKKSIINDLDEYIVGCMATQADTDPQEI